MTIDSELPVFTLTEGSIPLLISIPHMGTHIPADIARSMTPLAQRYDDTDWHLDRLYDFAHSMGASILQPTCSRYVVDLNRPPDGANLYPGQDTTLLCPVDTFDKERLYPAGGEPDDAEQARRCDLYWRPYHAALEAELARLKAAHDGVLLWEAHSIRSHLPRFFEGRLPDFNFGTASDTSAPPELAQDLVNLVTSQSSYSAIANGRFKGGHITRKYGKPADNIYAVQLELTQITYMNESHPYTYDEALAGKVQPVIQAAVEKAMQRCLGARA